MYYSASHPQGKEGKPPPRGTGNRTSIIVSRYQKGRGVRNKQVSVRGPQSNVHYFFGFAKVRKVLLPVAL